ncbi:MAG: hypothetical protein RBJ76_09960 [Stenomitos frigidus ULC029]
MTSDRSTAELQPIRAIHIAGIAPLLVSLVRLNRSPNRLTGKE